jgi:predicted Zn-dependent peptidase
LRDYTAREVESSGAFKSLADKLRGALATAEVKRDPIDPHVETSALDNGLQVVTVTAPPTCASPSTCGPRFERPAENGLSHMVEHMLFRGTARHRSSRALSSAIESLGAVLDGATDRDLGVLHMSLPPERLGAGLELLSEVVLRPGFADLEAERALVLEEMSGTTTRTGWRRTPRTWPAARCSGGHPLGQRILGPRANVERFTAADVRRHHARFYTARNAALCAAGPVAHAAVAAGAACHFGGMRPGLEAEAEPAPPVAGGPRACHAPASGSLVSVALTLRGITRSDPADYAAFEALLRVLDGGMSGRVYQALCVRDGLAYSVDAEIVDHVDATLLQFTSEVAPANLAGWSGTPWVSSLRWRMGPCPPPSWPGFGKATGYRCWPSSTTRPPWPTGSGPPLCSRSPCCRPRAWR